jgi:GNAT superfamily N-acetyltransferase
MFVAIRKHSARDIAAHVTVYRKWLPGRLRSGHLIGFIAEDARGHALGSGCVWFQPDHPRPGHPQPRVPYVMSMFTEPRARGRGVATAVVRAIVALARERGYRRVVLHAAPMGRPVYARLGFEATAEMRLNLESAPRKRAVGHRGRRAAT